MEPQRSYSYTELGEQLGAYPPTMCVTTHMVISDSSPEAIEDEQKLLIEAAGFFDVRITTVYDDVEDCVLVVLAGLVANLSALVAYMEPVVSAS